MAGSPIARRPCMSSSATPVPTGQRWRWLQQALAVEGIPTWRDERDLNPYQDFSAEIEEANTSAQHVVVCLHAEHRAAQGQLRVRREIIYSQGCGVPLTPVLAPGFRPPACRYW